MTTSIRAHYTGRSARTIAAAALVAALGAPRPSSALTDEEVYRNLRFQVEAPGARAAGMGGAHVAVADDPAAAWTNPSGLGFLSRPQVFLSFKGTAFDDTAGSIPGLIPGLSPAGSVGSLLLEDDSVASADYIGYMHPIGSHWVVGVSRHEWMNIERDAFTSFQSTAFPTFEGSSAGVSREGLSSESSLDTLVDNFSASVAFRPHERVSIGVSLGMARLDMVQTVDNYTYSVLDANGNGQADTLLRPIDYQTIVDDSDTQFTWAAGVTWRPMDTMGIGIVYRDGPTFDVTEQIKQGGVRADALRDYLVLKGIANTAGEFTNRWSLPESYAVGISFGPYARGRRGEGGITIALDAEHVEYADLLDGFTAGLNQQMFASASTGVAFAMEDETNYHFGVGYSWTVGYNNMIHVRAGAFTDEDHSITSSGATGTFVGRDGGEIIHATVGAGFTLRRGFYSFEMDAAADFSDLGEQYWGSALFKF